MKLFRIYFLFFSHLSVLPTNKMGGGFFPTLPRCLYPPFQLLNQSDVMCCHVGVSATGRSLVQMSPTECV